MTASIDKILINSEVTKINFQFWGYKKTTFWKSNTVSDTNFTPEPTTEG